MGSNEMNSMNGFQICSWNVNGIRTIDVKNTLDTLKPHILAIQETKITRSSLDNRLAILDNFTSYFSFSRNKAGYSGVASYVSDEFTPEKASEGLSQSNCKSDDGVNIHCDIYENEKESIKISDAEGRTIITQHSVMCPNEQLKPLTVINVYSPRFRAEDPNNTNEDSKFAFHSVVGRRALEFRKAGHFVLIVGDFNIRHKPIDSAYSQDPRLKEECDEIIFRNWLDDLFTIEGFVDTFRYLNPEKREAYTCWNTKLNCRVTNYGTRIDLIVADQELNEYLNSATIHNDIMGSDHCPISAKFHTLRLVPSRKVPTLATKFYPEFSGKQQSLLGFLKKPSESGSLDKNIPKRPAATQLTLNNFFSKKAKTEREKAEETEREEKPSTDESFYKEVNSGASAAWKQLFKKPEAPVCPGHQEPCLLRSVRRKGVNMGRKFWSCPRGNGQSSDPNSNCEFFLWARQ